MKRLNRILIFFFLLLAIGCSSQTTTLTALPITEIVEYTETPNPTSTLTTSPSSTPEQVSIEFPEWVKNPETQILLAPVGTRENGYENMALFNAETGERFDIPFTEKTGMYFWTPDGQQIGFLPDDQTLLRVFFVKDGSVSFVNLPESSYRFFQHNSSLNFPTPVQVASSNFDDPGFIFLPSWYSISSNQRYFIPDEFCSNFYFCIFDIQEEKLINVFEANSKSSYLFYEISPDSKYVAVVETDKKPGIYFTFEEEPTFYLRVYNIATKQLFASYKNITSADWSPDGHKFLYPMVTHQEYYSFWGKSPCIFDTLSGKTKCYGTQGIVAFPAWVPDQTKISFIYSNKNGKKGFCLIELTSEELNCILDILDTDKQMPINYKWSPDSNFIFFSYDDSCPYCDYREDPQFGVANIRTGKYFSIGYRLSDIYDGLWRPSLNP